VEDFLQMGDSASRGLSRFVNDLYEQISSNAVIQ
jgi:hypothetical protein